MRLKRNINNDVFEIPGKTALFSVIVERNGCTAAGCPRYNVQIVERGRGYAPVYTVRGYFSSLQAIAAGVVKEYERIKCAPEV